MKDKRFEGINFSSKLISPEFMDVLVLVADKEYDEALQIVDEYIDDVKDDELKNIAALMSLQILALAGYGEIASVLLKALLKKFKIHSQAKGICKRTLINI